MSKAAGVCRQVELLEGLPQRRITPQRTRQIDRPLGGYRLTDNQHRTMGMLNDLLAVTAQQQPFQLTQSA